MAVRTWTGAVSSDWENSGNWRPKFVPGSGDKAVLPTGSVATVGNAPTPPDFTNPDGIEVGSVSIATGASVSLIDGSPYLLTDPNTGDERAFSSTEFTIDGTLTSSIAGTLNVGNGSFLIATGTFNVGGTIALNADQTTGQVFADDTVLGIYGAVNLTGTGGLVLSDSINNIIAGSSLDPVTADVLTNHIAISGGGFIGEGYLTLVNDGTITATSSSFELLIDTGAGSVTNNGTMEADNSQGLHFYVSDVNNRKGIIEAAAGSFVSFDGGGSGDVVSGGQLAGTINVSSSGVEFDGTTSKATIDASGPTSGAALAAIEPSNPTVVTVEDGATLELAGTIDNEGEIKLNATGSDVTALSISGTVVLGGGGDVKTTDATGNEIVAAAAGAKLVLNEAFYGVGAIGDGSGNLSVVNNSVIFATGTNTLTIDTGNTLVNHGTVLANNGDGVVIDDIVNNTGGTLTASYTSLTLTRTVNGAGSADATAGLLDFKATVSATQVSLMQTSTLELDQAQNFHGTVAGLDDGSGNALDLTNIAFAKLQPASFVENSGNTQGVLTLTDGTHTAQITLLGNYTAAFDSSGSPPSGFAGFELTKDSGHGTHVTYIAAASG